MAVSGDGGFLMNCQELETACRLGVSFVTVIFRDDAYGVIRCKQQTAFGREWGVAFGNPGFVTLAAAYGARGYRVESASNLGPILREALASPGPTVVDVLRVDRRERDWDSRRARGRGARGSWRSEAPPGSKAGDKQSNGETSMHPPERDPPTRRHVVGHRPKEGGARGGPAFLFDLDGTLVDSVYQHVRVYEDPADLLRHLDEVGVRVAG